MTDRPYKVYKIHEGVVIDHIPAGKALQVINVLGLRDVGDSVITLGMNLKSSKMGRKDVLKIEKKELSKDDFNKIILIAPKASVNIIKDEEVSEKVKLQIPDEFINLIWCSNPKCITRNYKMESRFRTVEKEPMKIQCAYCEKVFDREEVDLRR